MKKTAFVFWILVTAALAPLDGFGQARIREYPSRLSVWRNSVRSLQRTPQVRSLRARAPAYATAGRMAADRRLVAEERNEIRLQPRQTAEIRDASAESNGLAREVAALKEEVRKLAGEVLSLAGEAREARKAGPENTKIEALKKELRELRAVLSELRDKQGGGT